MSLAVAPLGFPGSEPVDLVSSAYSSAIWHSFTSHSATLRAIWSGFWMPVTVLAGPGCSARTDARNLVSANTVADVSGSDESRQHLAHNITVRHPSHSPVEPVRQRHVWVEA